MGCQTLLQGLFLTMESNPPLLNWQAGPLPLVSPGKPMGDARDLNFSQHWPNLFDSSVSVCPSAKQGRWHGCPPKTGTAVLPLRGKVYGSEEMKSLLCFPGRIATYPSQCQSQIVCPVDLFVGCEPVRGVDSDRSNICSRSQRPVGKGDGNQTSRLDFSHWTRHLRGQNLWSGFLTIYRLPISLCLEAGGALGA